MMNTLQFILSNFKKFLSFKKRKLFIIYILAVLLAFTQGIGFIMLIPLLQILNAGSAYSENLISEMMYKAARVLHIQLTLESILIIYVIILSIYFLLQYSRIVLQSSYQHEHSGFLRKELFRKVIFSDWKVLTKISRSQHIQAFTTEIPRVTHFYFYLLNASTKIIILTIHILLAFLVSPPLTAVVVITGAVMFAVLAAYFRKSYGLGMQGRKTFRKVMKNIDDFWVTIKPAKVHKTEQFYYDNYARTDQQFVSNQVQQIRNNQKPVFLFNLFGLLNLVIVIFIAARFFHIHLTVLIVIILLFSRILPLFMSFYQDVNLMFLNAESVKNLQRMNLQPNIHPVVTQSPYKLFQLNESITISGLSFTYPSGKQIFLDFNVQIKALSLTGITGESGSGKTTLIDMISGLLQPDKGRIFYDDQDLNGFAESSIRQGISYLPQESLFIDGTLRENLIWDATQLQMNDIEIMAILERVNAAEFLRQKNLTLDSYVENFRFIFSGGELQRLALARSLIRKPFLLILDEATSALDEKNEDAILSLLQEIKKSVTIIFVTHKKRLIQSFDDSITLDEPFSE